MPDAQPRTEPPAFVPRTRSRQGRTEIFDVLRRRWVCLTPEEGVRQYFVHCLTAQLGYPPALLANEVSLMVGGVRRRCDTLLYHPRSVRPRMVVEYKAPGVAISQQTFIQIQSYNNVLRADYLTVTNGRQTFCCHMDYRTMQATFLERVPCYDDLA